MPLIKKYKNRKLYNTDENKYVVLDDIAKMVQAGEDVQVIDNVTGEDLTAETLTQIITGQWKKERDFLPRSILAELIQAGGESLNVIREKLGSPTDFIQQVDQEIAKRLDGLIQRGEIAEEAGRKLRGQLTEDGQLWATNVLITEEDIEDALIRQGIPTRDEFQKLIAQIDALGSKLDKL